MRLLLAFVLMTAIATSPAKADLYGDVMKSGKIRVGMDLTGPPFGMLGPDLKPTGLDYDVAKALANDWKVQLEIVETSYPNRIPNLLSSKVDVVISALSVTPERREVVDFTRPYSFNAVVLAASDGSSAKGWDSFTAPSVAVVRGTVPDTIITPIAAERKFAVVRFEDQATLATAAVTNQARVLAAGATEIALLNQQHPTLKMSVLFPIRKSFLAIGLRKGEISMKTKLDEWIASNLANGKLGQIHEKYQGVGLGELPSQ